MDVRQEKNTSANSQTFVLFDLLPAELQLQIWHWAYIGRGNQVITIEKWEEIRLFIDHSGDTIVHDLTRTQYDLGTSIAFSNLRAKRSSPSFLEQVNHQCRELKQRETCLSIPINPKTLLLLNTNDAGGASDDHLDLKVIPHSQITRAGLSFYPNTDLIYFKETVAQGPHPSRWFQNYIWDAKFFGIQMDNIQNLAVSLSIFAWLCSAIRKDRLGFKQLRAVVAVMPDDDSDIRDELFILEELANWDVRPPDYEILLKEDPKELARLFIIDYVSSVINTQKDQIRIFNMDPRFLMELECGVVYKLMTESSLVEFGKVTEAPLLEITFKGQIEKLNQEAV